MVEIVNLRQARKAKRRQEDAASAQASRLLHGRTKAEKRLTEAEREREERRLEGARRGTANDAPPQEKS